MRERRKVIKGQTLLYVALLGVTIALMVMLSRCDQPRPAAIDHPSGGDTLDVAIEYSPITYYSYDDTLGGFDYDLLRLISQHCGRPMKFHPIVTLSRGLEGLNDSTYDVLVAQFPTTVDGRERYLFTNPIYIDKQVLVQQAQNGIKRHFQLAGDTVWVVKGSPMKERIEGLSREIGDTIHVMTDPTYGAEQLLLRVAAGEIKYAVVNQSIARIMSDKVQGLDISIDISLSQFQAWVLRKNNQALCDSLNRWIDAAKANHDLFEQLNTRYFQDTQQ
ncbi:MAG: transporter substrate-binding domain-containing protein [Muribaculaceae bacterium]|nr:transporter substrate-binding domain-containing protein [Muribaculaceae bacterium]